MRRKKMIIYGLLISILYFTSLLLFLFLFAPAIKVKYEPHSWDDGKAKRATFAKEHWQINLVLEMVLVWEVHRVLFSLWLAHKSAPRTLKLKYLIPSRLCGRFMAVEFPS